MLTWVGRGEEGNEEDFKEWRGDCMLTWEKEGECGVR